MKKVSARLTGLKNPMKSHEKTSARAEKMIDRRGKMEIAKTAKATDKFLPGFTSNFSFNLGWIISHNRDFFQPRSAGLKFSHVISPLGS